MLSRILFSAAFVFVALSSFSPVHAQSASDVQAMLTRMQTIMSEMQKLQAEFQELTAQITAGSGSGTVLGAQTSTSEVTPIFTESLEYGETNDDIARIQRLLATDPEIYSHPHITGFFGPKTEEAIMNLQERFGYERVGVIGPATTKLLEGWMRAYPDENYPDGVLSTKPTVLGASTSNTDSSGQIASLQDRLEKLLAEGDAADEDDDAAPSDDNPLRTVYVEIESGEAWIDVVFVEGGRESFTVDSDEEDEIVEEIADEVDVSESFVRDVLDIDGNSSRDEDEDDAKDAIEDAEDAIDEAEDEIDEADEDGDDTDWAEDTLDDAERKLEKAEDAFDDEDWDEAVEYAEEAEELAEDAIDRIDEDEDDEDSDEIASIEADIVGDHEAEITVEYENDDEESFDVDEDRKEDIIEEVADELDMDEDDVEDLIEFDYGDIDDIDVYHETGRIRIEIEFESGVDMRLILDEDLDDDEIIEEIADELDMDEDDVEDVIDL